MRAPLIFRAQWIGGIALLSVLAGCKGSSGHAPVIVSVSPAQIVEGTSATVLIAGQFSPHVVTDFDQRSGSQADATFQVRLGNATLTNVSYGQDGSLTATVPTGLATGTFDLTVIDPSGAEGSLPGAFKVVALTDLDALVAGFTVVVGGTQTARSPFAVTIAAVDGQGNVVPTFNGQVSLSDTSGTVVPTVAGAFRLGVWAGQVEVRAPNTGNVITARDTAGRAGASAAFVVNPRPGALLRFTSPAQTVAAGACSTAVTVTLRDDFGYPAQATSSTALSLQPSEPSGFTWFQDAACATPLSSFAIPVGQTAATAYFKASRVGPLRLSVSATGLRATSQQDQIIAGAPSQLKIVSAPQVQNAGHCSQAVMVRSQDAFGNASALGTAAIALSASPSSGFTFYSDASCTTATSTLAFSGSQTDGQFYFIGNVAQSVSVSVSAASVSGDSQAERIIPEGFASQLVFTTPAQSTTAGACSGIVTVQEQDSLGNAVQAPGSVQVGLAASPSAGFGFFADAACTQSISATNISTGASTSSFYFSGSIAEAVQISASATAMASATQLETIRSGPPSGVAFTSAPQTVTSGSCSAAATFQLRDVQGNPAPAASSTSISLAAAPASGFAFFSDSSCTSAITRVTLGAGQGAGSFYFKGTVAASETVTLTSSGLTGDSQVETINAGAPTQLAFATPPQTVSAGACSGAVTIETRDANNNPAAVSASTTVTLAAAPSTRFGFYSDAACSNAVTRSTVTAGSSSTSVFFKGTASASVGVTVSASGLQSANQTETIAPASASQLAFTTPPRSVTAGVCSAALGFQTQDAFGNASGVASNTAVQLSGAPSTGLQFFSDAGCTALISSVSVSTGGSAGTFYFEAQQAGSVTITLSATALSSANQTETVNAGTATQLAFTTPPRTVSVGACSPVLTVQMEDSFQNAANATTSTSVSLSASPPSGLTFFSDATCSTVATSATIASGSAATSFHVKDTAPGSVTLTATVSGLTPAVQTETIASSTSPTRLAIISSAQTVTAGACSAIVQVQSQDSFNNPVNVASNTAVSLGASPTSGFAFFSDSLCGSPISSVLISSGTSTAAFYFRSTASGTFTITASSVGLNSASQTETISPKSPSQVVFFSSAQTVSAGACSAQAHLQSEDSFGNLSPVSAPTSVSLSAVPSTGFSFYSDSSCTLAVTTTAFATGSSDATFYFRGNLAGSVAVTAAVTGWTAANQTQTIQAGSPVALAFVTPPLNQVAGSCSAAVTVQAQDAQGNASAVSAATAVALSSAPPGLVFYSGAGCSTPITSATIAASSSSTSFFIGGTLAGTFTARASAAGLSSGAQSEVIRGDNPNHLAFITARQTLVAGTCSGAVTVEAQDRFNNPSPVTGATLLALSASPGAGFGFDSDASCLSPTSSATIAATTTDATFYFRGTIAGAVNATATASGLTATTQSEQINPGATARFVWEPIFSPEAVAVPFAVAIHAQDSFGNATPTFAGTAALSISPSAPAVSCATSCTDASNTGPFIAGTWTGSVQVASPGGNARTLTATSGSASGASNAFDVQPPPARSPPTAKMTASPRAGVIGALLGSFTVNFDASGSTDYQTSAANLQVSWDFSGTNTNPPPWTPWTTTKTASNSYTTAGTYYPRVAVKDGDGDIGYATLPIVLSQAPLLGGSDFVCTVNTNSDTDDGASDCQANFGTDGLLSLAEAIRISNGTGNKTIIFSAPMTISGAGTFNVTGSATILGQPNVIVTGKGFNISGGTTLISGLELTNLSVVSTSTGTLQLRDGYAHDMPGVTVQGTGSSISQMRFSRCTDHCVKINGAAAGGLTVTYSQFDQTGAFDGIELAQCSSSGTALDAYSNVFYRLLSGIRAGASCGGSLLIRNDTFHLNSTAVAFAAGASHVLRNNNFTSQTTAAVSCGTASFTSRDYSLLYQNNSDGCVSGDPNALPSDPIYAYPALADFRLQPSSPAKDTAVNLNLDLNGPGPRQYFGAGPDRGGRETY